MDYWSKFTAYREYNDTPIKKQDMARKSTPYGYDTRSAEYDQANDFIQSHNLRKIYREAMSLRMDVEYYVESYYNLSADVASLVAMAIDRRVLGTRN